MSQELIFTNNVFETIDSAVEAINSPSVFVIVDSNTKSFVLPRLQAMSQAVAKAHVITVPAGEEHKNIDTLAAIWNKLAELGATRKSLIINVGGGTVTDIGAFAASTFQRGLRFFNIPTSLLGAVDASVGGKTGINLGQLKNQVGLFSEAELVIVSSVFFNTLPMTELRSGYAEMLKHGLIESQAAYDRLLGYEVGNLDPDRLLDLLRESVLVKKRIVDHDPTEQGLRRALNLGHTAGHAFESLALRRRSPMPHGYAVAWGLVVAMILSHIKLGFPSDELHRTAQYVRSEYGAFSFTCDDYPGLLAAMSRDKKNEIPGTLNFTLLKSPGNVMIDNLITQEEISAALDIYRDLMGV